MNFPIEKLNELKELDRVMRVVGMLPCGLMVYVRTNENAYKPHVHICDVETRGCRFHECVLLRDWQYYAHPREQYPYCEGRRDLLTDLEKRQLRHLYCSKRCGSSETYWDYAVRIWNECHYPTSIGAEVRRPKFYWDICWRGVYGWVSGAVEGTGCNTHVNGPEFELVHEPHFHLGLAGGYTQFCHRLKYNLKFEISLVDILAKDELNLVSMRDSRNPEKEVVRYRKDECSWNGYEDLRDGLREYLEADFRNHRKNMWDIDSNFAYILQAWTAHNCGFDKFATKQPLTDYMRENGLRVLARYSSLLRDMIRNVRYLNHEKSWLP